MTIPEHSSLFLLICRMASVKLYLSIFVLKWFNFHAMYYKNLVKLKTKLFDAVKQKYKNHR